MSSQPTVVPIPSLVKLILLGDTTVGKTTFIVHFKSYLDQLPPAQINRQVRAPTSSTLRIERHNFQTTLRPCSQSTRPPTADVGRGITGFLYDTCGQESTRYMTAAYYRQAHVVILGYDVTHDAKLIAESINAWLADLQRVDLYAFPKTPEAAKHNNIIIVLVGFKLDLLIKRYKTADGRDAAAVAGGQPSPAAGVEGGGLESTTRKQQADNADDEDNDVATPSTVPPRKKVPSNPHRRTGGNAATHSAQRASDTVPLIHVVDPEAMSTLPTGAVGVLKEVHAHWEAQYPTCAHLHFACSTHFGGEDVSFQIVAAAIDAFIEKTDFRVNSMKSKDVSGVASRPNGAARTGMTGPGSRAAPAANGGGASTWSDWVPSFVTSAWNGVGVAGAAENAAVQPRGVVFGDGRQRPRNAPRQGGWFGTLAAYCPVM